MELQLCFILLPWILISAAVMRSVTGNELSLVSHHNHEHYPHRQTETDKQQQESLGSRLVERLCWSTVHSGSLWGLKQEALSCVSALVNTRPERFLTAETTHTIRTGQQVAPSVTSALCPLWLAPYSNLTAEVWILFLFTGYTSSNNQGPGRLLWDWFTQRPQLQRWKVPENIHSLYLSCSSCCTSGHTELCRTHRVSRHVILGF